MLYYSTRDTSNYQCLTHQVLVNLEDDKHYENLFFEGYIDAIFIATVTVLNTTET